MGSTRVVRAGARTRRRERRRTIGHVELLERLLLGRGTHLQSPTRFDRTRVDRRRSGRLQVLDRALDLLARLEQVAARLLARFALERSLLLLERPLAHLDPIGLPLQVLLRRGHLALTLAQAVGPAFDVGEQGAQVALHLRDPFLSAREHRLGHLEPPRDRDAVRTARDPLDQAVRRREALGVELQRGVDHTGNFARQLLERTQVGRRNGRGAASRELFEDRPA